MSFSAIPGILSSNDGGAYAVVDYREARDIDERDQIPERRVRAKYVSTDVREVQHDLSLKTDAGAIRHVAVGRTEGARLITIYLHGQGGSRKQGVDDFTFGGNFNRIKNLMAANQGLYLSPDFTDFGDKGAAEITALIDYYSAKSPDARIFIACGSMGGGLCWELAGKQGGCRPARRSAPARIALGRRVPDKPGIPGESAGVFRPRQQGYGVSARQTGSLLTGRSGRNLRIILCASCVSKRERMERRSA